jgi:hypothetical protein
MIFVRTHPDLLRYRRGSDIRVGLRTGRVVFSIGRLTWVRLDPEVSR